MTIDRSYPNFTGLAVHGLAVPTLSFLGLSNAVHPTINLIHPN